MLLHTLARPTVLSALLLAAVALTAPAARADETSSDLLFVTVPMQGKVVVIDRRTMQPDGQILVGGSPRAIAVTPDGSRLAVVNKGLVRLQIVDVATRTVLFDPRLVGGDSDLMDVVITPDGEDAYVSSTSPSWITKVNLETGEITSTTQVPQVSYLSAARGIALTPDGATLFVVTAGSRLLHAYDVYDEEFTGLATPVPAGCEEMALSADGTRGIIVGADGPAFFDTATGTVTSVAEDRGTHLDVSVVGNLAYVTNVGTTLSANYKAPDAGPRSAPVEGQAAIDVYDLTTGELVAAHALPEGTWPYGVVAVDDTHVYPCMEDDDTGHVLAFDGVEGTAGATASTGGVPYRAAWAKPGGVSVVSFFLPTAVKMKLAGAGKDALVTSGLFDDGDLPVDFTQPVTLDVGDFSRTFSLEPVKDGKLYVYRSPEIQLTLTPTLRGSSRGKFRLKIQKTTLQGLVDADGPCDIHFRATGLPDMAGTVVLEDSGYRRARKRGALLTPPFFAGLGQFTLKGEGQDSCVVRWGFSSGQTTPASLSDVRIGIGALDMKIPGDAFVKSTKRGEELFVATLVEGTSKVTVSLDYKRELARVVAKNVELGPLEAGMATDFVLDPGNGAGVMTNHVRLGGSGKKVFY
jgi:DNA-binding beta-propeller fold protein YncE